MATATAPPSQSASDTHRRDPRGQHFWTAKDMPPQNGKTFVVTGASSGLGFACAESIARRGGHVVIAARDPERCQKAAEMIKESGGSAEGMVLDLSSFRSVVAFAEEYKRRKLPLNVLVENAGVFLVPFDHTKEGFEQTVGINYFGHFLLTHLLIDQLRDTAKSAGEARIVKMSSLFEQLGSVKWNDLEGYQATDSSLFEYSNSKVMVIMSARELNKRFKGTNIEVFSSQPGLVQTPLNGRKLDHQKWLAKAVDISTKIYGQSASRASYCLQRPATDPNVKGYGGSYFSPPWISILALQSDNAGMREPSNSLTRDQVASAELYRQTLRIVNDKLQQANLKPIQAA